MSNAGSYISPDLHSVSFPGRQDKSVPFVCLKVARGLNAILCVNRCVMIQPDEIHLVSQQQLLLLGGERWQVRLQDLSHRPGVITEEYRIQKPEKQNNVYGIFMKTDRAACLHFLWGASCRSTYTSRSRKTARVAPPECPRWSSSAARTISWRSRCRWSRPASPGSFPCSYGRRRRGT